MCNDIDIKRRLGQGRITLIRILWFSISVVVCTEREELISELRGGDRRLQGYETEIAWLLAFPNSGTTYTQRLVQVTSGRSVASNYGHEMINEEGNVEKRLDSIPVFDGSWSGPFRTANHLSLPESGYTLTKTHCGGYCFSDCPPTWYRLSPLKFLQECRLGMRHDAVSDYVSRETWVQYDYLLVKRVVHLLRSPFENIVSRFFHEIKIHTSRKDNNFLKKYPKSPVGFKAWCSDTDKRWKFHEITAWGSDFFRAAQGVPCHGEITRIVRWHNNAFALHDALKVPTLLLHYADFNDDFTDTLDKLLSFLHLQKNAESVPFLYSNHDQYYLPWERVKMSEFIRFIATPATLKHLDRYLVSDLEQEQKKVAKQADTGFLFYNVKNNNNNNNSNNNQQLQIISNLETEKVHQSAAVNQEAMKIQESSSSDHNKVNNSTTNNNNANVITASKEATSSPTINSIPKNISRTQELLFFNNNNFGTTTKQVLRPKVSSKEKIETEQKILNLINHDWQKNNTSLQSKLLHVQAGLQKMSMLSDVNEDGKMVLQFFKRNS